VELHSIDIEKLKYLFVKMNTKGKKKCRSKKITNVFAIFDIEIKIFYPLENTKEK
jgi:hypothetical protein